MESIGRVSSRRLRRSKLPAYLKTTGSRGLHVAVPLHPQEDFDSVRAFARQLAGILGSQGPERYTLEQYKNKRQGRVFIDTNRNAYAQTAVAAYAVRARRGAPVAVPLDWSELHKSGLRPDGITMGTLFDRPEKTEGPWKDFFRHAVSLGKKGDRRLFRECHGLNLRGRKRRLSPFLPNREALQAA